MNIIKEYSGDLSTRQLSTLLSVQRSRIYYKSKAPSQWDQLLCKEIEKVYENYPFFGYRKMHALLQSRGLQVNKKKVYRLMKSMNIQALYTKKKTTLINKKHKKYPYLLKGLTIKGIDHVWGTDITYIRVRNGYIYLVCLLDHYSRRIMGWSISPLLGTQVCADALEDALTQGKPAIINTDQGCQFTSNTWQTLIQQNDIQPSMDGKGRWVDNILVERLWRTIKYELVYLLSFETVRDAREALSEYISFYNEIRPHMSLKYKTPNEVYYEEVLNNIQRIKYYQMDYSQIQANLWS